MSKPNELTKMQLTEFAENYLEKVFYYCLKRTGSSFEAEDLASDITLNIVSALNGGTIPVNFSAWVWQIARNRYSAWADRKRRHRESVAGADIGDYEIVCENASAEDSLIHGEELALLRRELSFISSDYRDIIIAYYIKDKKVQDIAADANLSPGTVKSKLFRARKKLKEGMNMAREFGTKSFKPENIRFAATGNQPSGLPWNALRRKLPKNILLEASNNPSTIEELSVELGTAVPYMEEEAELLVNATLLKKTDNKYITDFFIFDKESQLSIYAAQRKASQERSKMLGTIAADSIPLIRNLGSSPDDMNDNDLMWWCLFSLLDHCILHLKGFNLEWPARRANGESWGMVGYEQADLPENCHSDHTGNGDNRNMLWIYSFSDYGLWNRKHTDYSNVLFLADVIRNNRSISSFSIPEQRQWKEIEGRFAHADAQGNIIPDIIVLYSDAREKLTKYWESHPFYEKVMENLEEAFQETIKILKKSANPILHEQLPYCASSQMFDCRMMTLHDAVNSGRLIPPANPENSKIAIWMELES